MEAKRVLLSGLIVLVLGATGLLVAGSTARAADSTVIYVDQANPVASDTNAGTATAPLRTISRAVALADQQQQTANNVTIRVGQGTYRESVQIGNRVNADSRLTIEGAGKGRTVISGSDVWTGWVPGGSGTYSLPWTNNWGLAPAPSSWNASALSRRHELVFVDGALLRQYMSFAELAAAPSGFFVDEAADRIHVKSSNRSIPQAVVEVSLRTQPLTVDKRAHLTLRGFTVQHGAGAIQQGAVAFTGVSDLLVEDVEARQNNWSGFNIYGLEAPNRPSGIVMRRVDASDNGSVGIAGYRAFDLHVLDSATNRNGFRVAWGDLLYQEDGGVKLLFSEGWEFDHHSAIDNVGMGIWHDTGGGAGAITNSLVKGNGAYGIFVEVSAGPVTLSGNRACQNDGPGLTLSQSENVTVESNQVFANRTNNGQVTITGYVGGRTMNGVLYRGLNTTFRNNTVVGDPAGSKVIEDTLGAEDWQLFVQGFRASGNRYWSTSAAAFNWYKSGTSGRANYDFATWQASTGQDADSTWGQPTTSLECTLPSGGDSPSPTTTAPTTSTAAPTTTTTVAPTTTTTRATQGKRPGMRSTSSTYSVVLSTLSPVAASNGYGPYETNQSNGEGAADDGRTITLDGVRYRYGLGVNSPSSLTYDLGGAFSRFTADVGIDDEISSGGGSVVFEVWVDGVRAYVSDVMTYTSATAKVSVDVSGAHELRLVVTDAGDGQSRDHADWADARLVR